jgi:hypothetical protein
MCGPAELQHPAGTFGAVQAVPRPAGRVHLPTGWRQLAALGLAVAVAGWLIAAAPRGGRSGDRSGAHRPAAGQPRTLAQAWPGARVVTTPGQLPDGADYLPWLYPDPDTSVGTAPTPDGTATRLVVRRAGTAPVELRRIGNDRYPQFLAFTAAGDDVYWAESTAAAGGRATTRIWHADWRSANLPAAQLTDDAGEPVFYNSQYDIVVADGQVHWVAAASIDRNATELRSVPVGGGRVSVRPLPGPYVLSAWPWLVSANGNSGPLELVDLVSGEQVRVATSAAETVSCSPAWCRVRVLAASGASRLDLMRPDGSDRHRIAGGAEALSVVDVALLDRFEVLTAEDSRSADPLLVDTATRSLLLYDEKTRTTVTIADHAGIVTARAGTLWWSTGVAGKAASWHALDLSRLA